MAVHHFTAPSFIAGWQPIASCPPDLDVEMMDERTGVTTAGRLSAGDTYEVNGQAFSPTHWRLPRED